ncbi:VOC family protein [Candidatus Uhrbacteria bacterium]|nr:VOC family protein [Candidatus Uhrbacteria bacterium]
MLNGLDTFVPRLLDLTEKAGIDVSGYLMDHVCYRVADMDRYDGLAHAWRLFAEKTHTSLVNGRPITVFVLQKSLTIAGRIIRVIELPAPKQGSSYLEGWEHAEFVIDEPFSHFMSRYDEHDFDTKSLGKDLNPELGYKLPEGLQIKFHQMPLEHVIEIERERGLALTIEE